MDAGNRDLITKRDAFVACMAALLLGAILSALVLVGSDIPLKCFEGGNLADWLAALGTWVIGYGAWKVANEAHRHRTQEWKESRRAEASLRASKLRAMSYASFGATSLEKSLKDLLTKDRRVNLPTLKAIFTSNEEFLRDMAWSDDDRDALDLDALSALAKLKTSFRQYLATVKTFDALVSKEADTFDARSSRAFALLISRVENMSNDAKIFVEHCNRLTGTLDLE
ncbi:TPA: hypothetical protein ACGCF6_000350 [Stenotrophomonas maltophilia]